MPPKKQVEKVQVSYEEIQKMFLDLTKAMKCCTKSEAEKKRVLQEALEKERAEVELEDNKRFQNSKKRFKWTSEQDNELIEELGLHPRLIQDVQAGTYCYNWCNFLIEEKGEEFLLIKGFIDECRTKVLEVTKSWRTDEVQPQTSEEGGQVECSFNSKRHRVFRRARTN